MSIVCLDQRLDAVDYCVVDVETTGFSPTRDAIVEIGCVRIRSDGRVLDSFSSLLDPGRPVSGSDIHGIRDEDVSGAPRMAGVAGHLARCMDGALLVSYNIYFDYPFLRTELLEPLGLEDDLPRLCCMYLRGLIGLQPSRLRLSAALAEQQLPTGDAHTAYDDAVATANLLCAYLRQAGAADLHTFEHLATNRAYQFVASWSAPLPSLPRDLPSAPAKSRVTQFVQSGQTLDALHPAPVGAAATVPPMEVLSLGRSVDRAWDAFDTERPEGAEQYLACLCDALADRRLTASEMVRLTDSARYYLLDEFQVTELHHRLFAAIVEEAQHDGEVSPREAEDAGALAELLGVAPDVVQSLLSTASPPARRSGRGRPIAVFAALALGAGVVAAVWWVGSGL